MTWHTDVPPPASVWLFLAIVLVNAARMIVKNRGISWAGIEGGLELEGKSDLIAMLACAREGVGVAISSSSGLILGEGSAWGAKISLRKLRSSLQACTP